MAYVAISEAFLQSVGSQITEMMNKELKAVQHVVGENIHGTEHFLLYPLWKENLHLKDQMPDKWKGKTKDVRLHFAIKVEGKETQHSAAVHTQVPVQLPPGVGAYWTDIYVTDLSSPAMQALIANAEMDEEVKARWKKVRHEILDFFRNCKSVNEALKLWPQIEMYVPEAYMKRVNVKRTVEKTKSAAAEVLEKMDTDALTSAAVIARMSK